jgi:hypothetical protein
MHVDPFSILKTLHRGNLFFFGVPRLATYIFFLFLLLNEPGLGAEIDPGMALTPLPTTFQS